MTLAEAALLVLAGGVRLPAALARHADPDAGGARVDHRHVRGHLRARASRSTRSRCSRWCLSVGIVVDDAIVVLENVERLMREEGMGAKEASIEAMHEVSGAVLAIVLVLCAVFIPVAFLGGIAGQLYKQFAVTVAISVVISGVMALTLTPALCALLLQKGGARVALLPSVQRRLPEAHRALPGRRQPGAEVPARWRAWRSCAGARRRWPCMFVRVPTSFIPPEDQGYLLSAIMLPDGASLQRTAKTGAQLQQLLAEEPGDRARLRRARPRHHRRLEQDQRRHVVHPAQGLGRTRQDRAADRRRALAAGVRVPGRHRADASIRRRSADSAPPAASRCTCRRAPMPIRRRSARAVQGVHEGALRGSRAAGDQHLLSPHGARSSRSTSTASRRSRSAFPSPTCSTPCRARWARST